MPEQERVIETHCVDGAYVAEFDSDIKKPASIKILTQVSLFSGVFTLVSLINESLVCPIWGYLVAFVCYALWMWVTDGKSLPSVLEKVMGVYILGTTANSVLWVFGCNMYNQISIGITVFVVSTLTYVALPVVQWIREKRMQE